MEQLGGSFKASGEILQHFMAVWTEELEMGHLRGERLEKSEEDRELGLEKLEKGILQKRIAGPLGRPTTWLPPLCLNCGDFMILKEPTSRRAMLFPKKGTLLMPMACIEGFPCKEVVS